MKKMYLFWAILALGVFAVGTVLAGVSFLVYVSIPALFVVLLPPFFLSMAVFPLGEIGGCYRAAFAGSTASSEQLKMAAAYFKAVQSYVLYAGMIGVIIGLIALLTFLGEAAQVGQNAAIALLTALYALIINIVLVIPFRAAVAKKLSVLGL